MIWTNSLLFGDHPSLEVSQTFSGGRELWVNNFKGINSQIVTFCMYLFLKLIWLRKLSLHSRIPLSLCQNYIISLLCNSHPLLVLLWIIASGCENLQGTHKGKAHFKLESRKHKHRKFPVFSCFHLRYELLENWYFGPWSDVQNPDMWYRVVVGVMIFI